MKFKVFCLSLVIISFAYLTGCMNVAQVTTEQSEENFKFYKDEIISICKKYDVKITDSEEKKLLVELYLSVIKEQEIYIRIINSAYYGDEDLVGREDFYISYNKSTSSNFNVDLFVDLVNAMSGKKLFKEFCEDFLAAPEEDYPGERYGDEKAYYEKSYKVHSLNLFEDWVIADTVYNDNTEELSFRGLTKTGTNG